MTSPYRRLLLLVTIFVTITSSSFAQHWPRFRGPSGSGIAESQPLRTTWDGTTGQGVLWKTAIDGVGHSMAGPEQHFIRLLQRCNTISRKAVPAEPDGI